MSSLGLVTQMLRMGMLIVCFSAGLSWQLAAQTSVAELDATTQGFDTLAGGGAPTGAGQIALDRARGLQGGGAPAAAPAAGNVSDEAALQMLEGDEDSSSLIARIQEMDTQGAASQVVMELLELLRKSFKVKAIVGTRVFDAVSGELLDDARERFITDGQKTLYYDDGTHGDPTPDDGQFALVDSRSDVIGPGQQRVKEQLVKALIVAENYDPLQFYGYTLMSTDQQKSAPRNRAYKLVPDPRGGPGMVLEEAEIEKPLELPDYRDKQYEKDVKVLRSSWIKDFLADYRKEPDSLSSEFHNVYIPLPPPVPSVKPPIEFGWMPFEMNDNAGGAGEGGTDQHWIDSLAERETKADAEQRYEGTGRSAYF